MVFTPTEKTSRQKLDCLIEVEYSGPRLRRGEHVLDARTPRKVFLDQVTLAGWARTSKNKDNRPL